MLRSTLVRSRLPALAITSLLIASCSEGGSDSANSSSVLTVRESFDGGMDALASGQLTIRDGCVFLVYDGQSKAVVWPTGTVLNASRDARPLHCISWEFDKSRTSPFLCLSLRSSEPVREPWQPARSGVVSGGADEPGNLTMSRLLEASHFNAGVTDVSHE